MNYKDNLSGDVALFELSGKIMGGSETTQFRGRLHEYLDMKVSKFIVDMSEVEWINSEGIGMLIRAHRAVTDTGGTLVIAHVEGKSEQLLSMTQLMQKIGHYGSAEDALLALKN